MLYSEAFCAFGGSDLDKWVGLEMGAQAAVSLHSKCVGALLAAVLPSEEAGVQMGVVPEAEGN